MADIKRIQLLLIMSATPLCTMLVKKTSPDVRKQDKFQVSQKEEEFGNKSLRLKIYVT